MEGGPDRKIRLDHSPGLDEVLPLLLISNLCDSDYVTNFNISRTILQLYIEGYLQAMLDVVYKQEYLRVRVVDDQVTFFYPFAFCNLLNVIHLEILFCFPRTSKYCSLSEQSNAGLFTFQVILKNLPPNSALINEIVDSVKSFLVSKALLKGDSSTLRPLRHLRNERVSFIFTRRDTLRKMPPAASVTDLTAACRNGGLRRRC